ncbi:response regulator transcription factor [Rufibacter glacialis]|uniref:Response regulator transcription factor n=1 Tax=Rufibacter glacialis TaxID=1259555 RepID=A0A5M8QLL1_9BACT|nr:response regulator transcription factor [Rufibacter glacialis]KAA6435860.1 response regulator transcription factor [Rufibacter glacialis]GGK67186.1 DNA-binding response regulator [Rufibacter glacialis]
MHTLIVEDETSLATELMHFLAQEHYICDWASNGREASEKIAVNRYDFILLDLGLPDYDGLDLLQETKAMDHDPAIIILTARGALEDRIRGLGLGADDYLPKPFSLLELQARMQAVLRRKFKLKSSSVAFHGFEIDSSTRRVTFGAQEIVLTKKEFDILHYLLLHKNRILTRLQLTEHIWGNLLEDDYDSNYIDVHIKNLRKKLSAHATTDWLETVRGVGYRLTV